MEPTSTADARRNLADLMNRAAYGGEPFVVTRHGKELVAIVPVEEARLLKRLGGPLEAREFESALKEIAEAGTIPRDETPRELDP